MTGAFLLLVVLPHLIVVGLLLSQRPLNKLEEKFIYWIMVER